MHSTTPNTGRNEHGGVQLLSSMNTRYQRDVLKCVECEGWIAQGDSYCKHCGYAFSRKDAEQMLETSTYSNSWGAPFHDKFDEMLRCPQCNGHVAGEHGFCRYCGKEFTEQDLESMRDKSRPSTATYLVAVSFFVFVLVLLTLVFGAL